jgi:tetratricopeptide (TPR) repeat protein
MMRNKAALILILAASLFLTSCFSDDPLVGIRRLARSSDQLKQEEASELYQEVIDTLTAAYAGNAGINKALGERLMFNQQFKPAIKHLETAAAIDTSDGNLFFWLGVCYVNLYKSESNQSYLVQAEQNYKTAYALSPGQADLLYSYAHLLVFALKEYNKATDLLEEYVTKTDDKDGWFLLGRTYFLKGNLKESYDAYNELYRMENRLSKAEKEALDEHIFTIRSELEKGLTR